MAELKQTEDDAQETIFAWARLNRRRYPELLTMYHPANEGKRSKAAGASLQRKGMLSGVSDICLPVSRSGYGCLYIELKVGNNKPTPEQEAFVTAVNQYGGKALIVYEADNAIQVIQSYLDESIDALPVKDYTYPADKHKRISAKRYLGPCGEDCRQCNNSGCLGRTIKTKEIRRKW